MCQDIFNENLNLLWPVRFPDLFSFEYFLWRYVKQQVYKQDVDYLGKIISKACQELIPDMVYITGIWQ